MEKEKVIILTGPSGVGKSSLKERLLSEFDNFVKILSHTTRNPRSDKDFEDYIFNNEAEFLEMKSRGEFLETSYHYGSWYGTPLLAYHEHLECHLNPVKDINIDGALKFKEEFKEGCVTVYIAPPSKEELKRRLKLRDGKVDSKRIKEFEEEQKYQDQFDYKIVNHRLDQAYEELVEILRKEVDLVATHKCSS